jgi:hypothetical protein
MMRFLAVALLCATGTGCPPTVCDPAETRCNGPVAEICGSDGVWRTLMDCAADGMVCCWVPADLDNGIPEGYSCLPECPAVLDAGT